MASEAPQMTPQLTAIRGVIRELSSLAVQKAALEASGGDTTAVERQITAFRTVVVGLQAALVPKPGSEGSAQAAFASPDAASQAAGAAPGPPSAAAARFLEAMEELRVAEAQLHDAPEVPQAAAVSITPPAKPAPARQSGSPAAAAVPSRPPAAALPVAAGAPKDASPAAPPAHQYMWTAPPMPPKPAPPAQPASPPAAPAAAPVVAAPPPAAAPPVMAAPPAAPAVEAAAPPAGNSRAIAAQKARLERQAAMLAAELATAREESSPRVEALPAAKGAAHAASAASAPQSGSPGMEAATSAKVEVLEAEIASLQSEIARLTSCSWLDTSALATQMTDASALIASVHAWAAQSTQTALEEALASTQKALDAAAGAVPALPKLEAPAVPSPLDAIVSFVAAEFQPFSLRQATPVKEDEPEDTAEASLSRAASLPPAAQPAAPSMSPPFRSQPVWSEPPALQHTSATTVVALPADLLSALPPELSAQLLRAAEEVAKPLDEPNTLQDFASAMRRETEERRRRQLAAARAAAAAAQPAEELDSMDAGGVL
jgi:hypothetical protein